MKLPLNLISYADDMIVLCSGESWQTVQDTMNAILETVGDWLLSNELSLNVNKSVFIAFSSNNKNIPENIEIKINNSRLKKFNNFKYLGIIFDSNLKWKNHVLEITNKTRYLLFVMYKLKQNLLPSTLTSIYYALFHNIAIFGIVAWGGTYGNHIKPIVSLQNKLIKILNTNCDNEIMKITESFKLNALLYYYNNLKTVYINNNSVTRNKSIKIPKIKKQLCYNRCYISAIRSFNKLPNNYKILEDKKKTLKNKLRKVIL